MNTLYRWLSQQHPFLIGYFRTGLVIVGCKAGAAFSESGASPLGCRDLSCEFPKVPQINTLDTSEMATSSERSRTMMSSLSLFQWENRPNAPRRAQLSTRCSALSRHYARTT
jgi:hypothetical protein